MKQNINNQTVQRRSEPQMDKHFIQSQGIAQRKPAPKTGGNGNLPAQLKEGVESLSGINMDDVKVHYNSDKPAQLQAHAYAQGTDIHLASGQEKHLPHEAWHVVQQKQGRVQPTTQMKGVNVNDNSSLETEADVMGARAIDMNSDGKTSPSGLIQRRDVGGAAQLWGKDKVKGFQNNASAKVSTNTETVKGISGGKKGLHAEMNALNDLMKKGELQDQDVLISDVFGHFTNEGYENTPIGVCAQCRIDIFDPLSKGGAKSVTLPVTKSNKIIDSITIQSEDFEAVTKELKEVKATVKGTTQISDASWDVLKKYDKKN